ncbi:DUF3375 domain-containing protein [Burkholderia ubonensis]|uniref:DUF3375 domain-containing protein n=1 Tax=Burkholderia ubonensis TaxID=101571 RepID=UPI0007572CD4|nr:DUF3375 domain-containing protein [Burkholderia ubonensis]KVO34032.1 hypothetical protein WJ75_20025 [Burkholderia ubonensis]KVZ84411.1 hypothetical protein WL22_30540 [Burkholderia ubonensis]KWE33134.1 hypothetical protein WL75_30780 [Burkholderia ubonensis]
MFLDYPTLDALRTRHPAWRLLRSDHAPLAVSFLHRAFVAPNVREVAAPFLAEALEDELYALREQLGDGAFPKPALEYLNDWASPEKGWLRKFYRQGSDEPHFDLTPAAGKAIAWLGTLMERSFVGTESRLLTLFELLRQMAEGSETDPERRLAELHARRSQIDEEIARVEAGDVRLLDDAAIKDRFQQFMQMARDLLTDFREVEQNFRLLDRHVRERIALWEGSKGALIEEIMGERDAIADSDQGSSFRAFWDFLMSSRRQEELSERLEHVLALPAITEMKPDARTRRVHYDWLEAGEHTQRTVAQLSQQLRRFLDDQAWLENRRIMDILRGIETKALVLREAPPPGSVMEIETASADIELPIERPLYAPALRPLIANVAIETGDADLDASALYTQIVVDRARLASNIRRCLQDRRQVTLAELAASQPLLHGLAELVAYLQLSAEAGTFRATVDETVSDTIEWQANDANGAAIVKRATMPRVIFTR